MHRRPSIALRPKTSSAVDDKNAPPKSFDPPSMKRTASQTFSTHGSDPRGESGMSLASVQEGMSVEYPSAHVHSTSLSLSRATHMLEGGFKQIRRKLSSSSTRRPSIQNLFDGPVPSSSTRKPSADLLRLPLPHQDSGLPSAPSDPPAPAPVNSKISMLKRFSSLRRRPAASGPSGDFAKFNPVPPPIPSNYPSQAPGSAARRAAAAANDARQLQLRCEQEQTRRFLESGLPPVNIEEEINDSESGVGMMCSSPITRMDSSQEKKMGKFDSPLNCIFPCECAGIIEWPLKNFARCTSTGTQRPTRCSPCLCIC